MLKIQNDIQSYIKNFLIDKKYIYITTITNEFVDMAYNWYLSLSRLGLENLCLIVCSDELTYNNLKKFDSKINCINLNIILPNNKNFFDWKEIEKKIKFTIPFYIGKNLKFPFFHSDVDIFFNKNPLEDIQTYINENYDIILSSDRRFDYFLTERNNMNVKIVSEDKKQIIDWGVSDHIVYGEENAAFSYININENSYKKIIDCYSNFFDEDFLNNYDKGMESGSAQTISNILYKKYNLKIKILDSFKYMNGSVLNVSYLNEKFKNNCILAHYNYEDFTKISPLELKNLKIKKMKLNNHWLL
jgi:hypothetical protein